MARRKRAASIPSGDHLPSSTEAASTNANGSNKSMKPATASLKMEPVKVDNASLTELKIACDDAVRRFFSRPEQFRTRHTHTDVRLALGWTSVVIAAATGYYGWKREFEEARLLVFVGVVLYFILTAVQTAYAYWIEGKTIYVGKRRTLVHRIEIERITIDSETKPAPSPSKSPRYSLTLSYIRSTGKSKKNKTIIRKSSATVEKNYTDLFDEEGTLDERALAAWLTEASASVIEDNSDGITADTKS